MMLQVGGAIDDVEKGFEQAKLDRLAKMHIARDHLAPWVERANDKEVKDRGREKALNRALGIVEGLFIAGLLTKEEQFDWIHWCDGHHYRPKLGDEIAQPTMTSPDFDDAIPF